VGQNDKGLRQAILKFIGDFSNWNLSTDRTYLEVSRGLVKVAHAEETPTVVDSFAGSGSIPLEALRLDCEAFAGELNPVASLILKVVLESIPRYGPELANELRRVGREVLAAAKNQLAEYYPIDPDGAEPIAYIWARTVRCESPKCGAEIPLLRGLWLSTKASHKRALSLRILHPKEQPPRVEFEIFAPKDGQEVSPGTVNRAKAACRCCGAILSPERVRAQLVDQCGGADVIFDAEGNRTGGSRLIAVVTLKEEKRGRDYRLPNLRDYKAIWRAQKRLKDILDKWGQSGRKGFCPIPDEPLPPIGTLGFRVQRYGMVQWGSLFSARQKVALVEIATKIRESAKGNHSELLALSFSKLAERNNSICDWMMDVECPGHLYTQQVIPPAWDFAEAVPICDSSGSFGLSIDNTATNAVACYVGSSKTGDIHQLDACELPLPDDSSSIFFTDPPYYDAVPYSDLSDFFFVWLKRTLPNHPLLRDPFDPENTLTPKQREAVQDEVKEVNGRPKDRRFFEETMARAFSEGRRVLKDDGVGCVVFAHKTTEGWEALLSGMISGGWVITGSWPIATERSARKRARDSAALATSVHLVCRPRPEDAPVGDWGEVLRELPKRVGDWMERLQSEDVRGADLVFACIGPALEIYSRYSKVVDAEEREIPLGGDPEASEPHRRGFLSYVWEVVGRTALEQVLGTAEAKARNSTAGALEEDARLTALFLWTLQGTNGNGAKVAKEESEEDEETDEEQESPKKKKQGYSLIFDVVRRFAQPLGIHLPEWEGRVIETEKGVVRLLSVKERVKQLFGEESISVAGFRIEEQARRDPQMKFDFAVRSEGAIAPEIKARRPKKKRELTAESSPKAGVTTTLDRVHAAMLLQASGQTNALRALLKAELERGPDFLRLANALSALYPRESEEKRLLDAMLLAVPR
jgi:adenine-specific DNA methylase